MKLLLNPSTATACTYVEGKPCKEPPVGELRGHFYRQQNDGKPWPMCERHLQPGMHPPDLRDKLHRWETAGGGALWAASRCGSSTTRRRATWSLA